MHAEKMTYFKNSTALQILMGDVIVLAILPEWEWELLLFVIQVSEVNRVLVNYIFASGIILAMWGPFHVNIIFSTFA